MESVTLAISKELKEKIVSYYQADQAENNGDYIIFFATKPGLTVTIFESKKQKYKVLFTGNLALKEARIFDESAKQNVKTSKVNKASWICLDDQVGSDEVGTGDFFGPICVCAAYVKKTQINRLKELGVDDSKRLSDDEIRSLGPILIKEFLYSQISVDNVKFNEAHEQGMNMVEMKVRLHNQCLYNVLKKKPSTKNVFVDQFVAPKNYYDYIFNEKNVVNNITFKTKGESHYPSVAVGSIIARYSFLRKIDEIEKKYNVKIPLGANHNVTEFARKFMNKFGQQELLKIVKSNFANYKELLRLDI